MNYTLESLANIFGCAIPVAQKQRSITQVSIDSRYITDPASTIFIALSGTHTDGHHFIPELIDLGVRTFLVDREMLSGNPEVIFFQVENVLGSLQNWAAFHRKQFQIPIIGITGSNGKTILKEWLSEILSRHYKICKSPKSYNSQLGAALSVLQLDSYHEIGIFEAGISRPGEMAKLRDIIQPTIGVLTNVGDAHDLGFESREQKWREKMTLFNSCQVLITKKDPHVSTAIQHLKTKWINWNFQPDEAEYQLALKILEDNTEIYVRHGSDLSVYQLPHRDSFAAENAIHLILTCTYLGLRHEDIQQGLSDLHQLSMRMELKEGLNDCLLINDSYILDLQSLKLGLQFMDQQSLRYSRTIVISDFAQHHHDESLFRELAELIRLFQVKKVVCIGSSIQELRNWIPEQSQFYHFNDTETLLDQISQLRFQGEIILIKGARKFKLERFFEDYSASRHDAILEIDLKAIEHNLQFYKSIIKADTKIMAVVKAASYGSGHYEIARLMEFKSVDYLAVAYPDEGILLREKGIRLPVLVMNCGIGNFLVLKENSLEPEIYCMEQCQDLEKILELTEPTDIHLKIDTGMHRLGFGPDDIDPLCRWLQKNASKLKVKSIFTHLSASDQEAFDEFTAQQLSEFGLICENIQQTLGYKVLIHSLSSSGIARWPDAQADMVRIGIGLYGLDSSAEIREQLEASHCLKAKISQIKSLQKGDTVSYNRSYLCERDMQIAIISVGYADGLPRNAGMNGFHVLVSGIECPILGIVCMDMCMIDISEVKDAHIGMSVEIFGKNRPVQQLALAVQTIPYEILCGISPRIKRIFLRD